MFIILYYTHYAYSNAGIVSDSTDDSWVGYDYNTETWIDMSDVNNDADVLLKSLDGNEVIHDGNIYLNDDEPDESSIFGDDDRSVVNMKNDSTSKGIVWLHSITTGDSMNTCSGTLIAENYVLTAAHCVTQATDSINKPCPSGADCVNGKYGDTSKFNKRINVYINRNNGITNDGYYSAHKVYVQQAWRIDGLIHSPYDIALIKLNEDADGHYPTDYGARVYGYGSFKGDFMGKHVSMISYPSDKWKTDKNMDGMWLS